MKSLKWTNILLKLPDERVKQDYETDISCQHEQHDIFDILCKVGCYSGRQETRDLLGCGFIIVFLIV